MQSQPTLAQVVSQIQDWVELFPQTEAYAFLLKDPAGKMTARSGEGVAGLLPALSLVAEEAKSRRTPWLSAPDADYCSCLCSPFTTSDSQQLTGLLVLGSRRPDAFSSPDVDRINLICRGFGDTLSGLQVHSPLIQGVPGVSSKTLVLVAGVGVGVLFLVVITRPRPSVPVVKPTRQSKTMTIGSAEPDRLAATLLQEASRGDAEGIYQLCSKSFQKRWPKQRFQESFQNWKSRPGARWELDYRRVQVDQKTSQQATLRIQPAESLGKVPVWIWTMKREDDGWKLDFIENGPFASGH